MRLRFILLTLLIVALAACTGGNEEPEVISGAEETIQSAATAVASAVPTVLTPAESPCEALPEIKTEGEEGVTVPENAVAVFEKTGGFAGVEERTVVYDDGRIENNKNESAQVPPEVVGTLVSTAADAGFFDLERDYVPEGYCCDFFNYSLTIRDCDRVHTVITADEAPGTPAELWQIIDTVQSLIANTSAAVPAAGTG